MENRDLKIREEEYREAELHASKVGEIWLDARAALSMTSKIEENLDRALKKLRNKKNRYETALKKLGETPQADCINKEIK